MQIYLGSGVGIQSDSNLVFVFDILKPPEINSTSLDDVTVTGKFGDEPKVEFEPAMSVEKTEIEVLSQGDGEKVPAGSQVKVNYQGLNGRTGDDFDSS